MLRLHGITSKGGILLYKSPAFVSNFSRIYLTAKKSHFMYLTVVTKASHMHDMTILKMKDLGGCADKMLQLHMPMAVL